MVERLTRGTGYCRRANLSIGRTLKSRFYCGFTESVSPTSIVFACAYIANLGVAGAGKTKLVSRIVDCYLDTLSHEADPSFDVSDESRLSLREPRTQAFAFFYCLRADDERRKPENIFCSFVKQIAQLTVTSMLPLMVMYRQKERRAFLSKCLSISECLDLLNEMSASFNTMVLVLDALDERQKGSRRKIIAAVNDLIERGIPVKVLISSRRNSDIKAELADRVNISISATDNGDDIMRFVRQRIFQFQNSKMAIGKAKQRNPMIPPELEEKIISIFLQKSDGMCVWQ